MGLKIKRASKNEIEDIVFLNRFVHKIHVENHPDIFKFPINDEKIKRFFMMIVDKEKHHLLVAYKDGKPVGYLWATLTLKPENPFKYEQKHFFLHQIAVHDQYRRQSIARTLFEEIESIASQNGVKDFALGTWSFNRTAHEFFEKMGFTTYNINMWRP
ncbi:MAG: GNAT family N-acetyltransferase [Deltaproteobacteria bacterium]|nr:GNAT family N-acetyltransferase [Deltaproteobacteria bacterium]